MNADMMAQREAAMDRADRELERVGPERKGANYVRTMKRIAKELAEIAVHMQQNDCEAVEQSRAYRYLGNIYDNLGPALGNDMLKKARNAYSIAETLLQGTKEPLERAKLDFAIGNALRQTTPPNIEQLKEAERRFLEARSVFAQRAPEHLPQVDEALLSSRNLLRLVSVSKTIKGSIAELGKVGGMLKSGQNDGQVRARLDEIRRGSGGPSQVLAAIEAIAKDPPGAQAPNPQHAELIQQIEEMKSAVAVPPGAPVSREQEIVSSTGGRLQKEVEAGRVGADRSKTLQDILTMLEKTVNAGGDDFSSLMQQTQQIRKMAGGILENAHYLSHGIVRPSRGSRAAELVEMCWLLRRFLLQELLRPNKGEIEGKIGHDLSVRATQVDRRIYEAGDDDARAATVESEALRPLALDVRDFSARAHPLLARPIWPSADIHINADEVYFIGSDRVRRQVVEACGRSRLKLTKPAKGNDIASARWIELQSANFAVFDLTAMSAPERAAVSYELGIARTLGKPVVLLARQGDAIPFDIDVDPVFLSGSDNDVPNIAEAIDRSLVWTTPRSRQESMMGTVDYAVRCFSKSPPNLYVEQTLRHLQQLGTKSDPVEITTALKTLMGYLGAEGSMLLYPTWPPAYPEAGKARLFHVMPYRPKWSDTTARKVSETCTKNGVRYVRGDQATEANVIRSIWDEICRASHILVDLTEFSPSVSLELGIAHTLGRPTLIVGQDETMEQLFPMISRFRFYTYKTRGSPALSPIVERFLRAGDV